MNDVFNSITLVILKYIYSLTGKTPLAKRIYDLYFCTALVFLFLLWITHILCHTAMHLTRMYVYYFSRPYISLVITF